MVSQRVVLAFVVRLLLVALAVVAPRVAHADAADAAFEDGIPLTGPWPAYEGVLLGLDDPTPEAPAFETTLPIEFSGARVADGRVLPRRGVYTVIVERDLPPTSELLALRLTRFWGASRVTCRTSTVGTALTHDVDRPMGMPTVDPAQTRSLNRWGIMTLPPGDHLRCVLQFANAIGTAGLGSAPVLGHERSLQAAWIAEVASNAVLFGLLAASAVYHLVLFRVRRERSHLYFGFVSLAVAFRAAVATRIYENVYPDSHAIAIIWGLDVGAIPLAAVGVLHYLREVLGDLIPRRFLRPAFVVGMALIALSFARGAVIQTEVLLVLVEGYFVLVVAVAGWSMVRALVVGGVDDVKLLVGGLGFAMLAGVYEVFAARGIVPRAAAVPIGTLVFVSCQGMLLVRRTERMHEAAERLARELEEKNEALARADALKDAFVAATSHELKTPLHGMLGLMESVREELSPRSRQSVDLAIASGRRLDTQISGLLDFAKLRRDELTLDLRPMDTAALVRSVVEASQSIVGARALEFRTEIPSDIAPILGDESRVRQVLFHIVGNAVKFTARGTVEVHATNEGAFVELVVRDTGAGIAEDAQRRVFDAFTQEADVDTRAVGGTGLGLTISKRLVELHGGSISLRSRPGDGTTVSLRFPASQLAVVAATTQEPTAVAMPVEYTTPPQALAVDAETSAVFDRRSLSIVMTSGVRDDRLTVLAVDDDPVNLRVLSTQLRPAGYRVVLASDGAEALEVFDAEGPFDLVLLDVMMPRMSGLEALRRLRAKATRAELPVILLTAKQQQEDVLAGFDAGANDYLTKPFSKKELLARIETHLTVAKTNHALRRFVPHEFLEALGRKHVTEVRLGDSVERRLAILFGDIRDFTRISEGLGPEKTFRFVNQCLKRITPSVRDNGGFIDKFIGDAVLALFPEDPKAAVDAAIAIERAIEETDAQDGDERFAFGIGIHVGPTMMGTIGDERRFEATVISDAVNQAARLEGMTKYVGARVLVSGDVVDELGSSYSLRPLGLMRPVGKETAIAVSEVLDADPIDLRENKHSYAPLFADATALLRAGSAAEALAIFTNLAAREPRDGAVKFFLAACHDAQLGHRVVVDGAIVLNRK